MLSPTGKALLGMSVVVALAAALWPSAPGPPPGGTLPSHPLNASGDNEAADSALGEAAGGAKCPLGYGAGSAGGAGAERAADHPGGGGGPRSRARPYQLYVNATIWTAFDEV